MKTLGKDHRPEDAADWLKRRAALFDPADPWLGKHAVEYRPHKISLILTHLDLAESGRHWHLSICFRTGTSGRRSPRNPMSCRGRCGGYTI